MKYKRMIENSRIRCTKDQIFEQKDEKTQEIGRKRHEKRKKRRKALRPGGGRWPNPGLTFIINTY